MDGHSVAVFALLVFSGLLSTDRLRARALARGAQSDSPRMSSGVSTGDVAAPWAKQSLARRPQEGS